MILADLFAEQLKVCAKVKDLAWGRRIHSSLLTAQLQSDRFLSNLLIDMYGKCGCLDSAREVFESILHPNLFSWNIMISACSHNSAFNHALEIFHRMNRRDALSWTTLIAAYSRRGQHMLQAQKMFDMMPMWDCVSYNSMISGFSEANQLQQALQLLDRMPDPDVVSWTVIIAAFAQEGELLKSKHLFITMSGRNEVVWTSTVSAYVQNGFFDEAKLIFDLMPQHNTVSWNSVLSAYAQNGETEKAEEMFEKVGEKDVASSTAMVAAYAHRGDVRRVREVFDATPNRDVVAWNALVAAFVQMQRFQLATLTFNKMSRWNLVSANGFHRLCVLTRDLDRSLVVFESMPVRNVVSWTSMLSAFASHKRFDDAKRLFARVPKHTAVMFSTLLQAYADGGGGDDAGGGGGYYDEVKLLFDSIPDKESDAFASSFMVALNSQKGHLREAKRIFDSMRGWDFVSWTSIIQAYAHNGRVRYAIELLRLMCLDGSRPNEITFIAILNGCSHAGLFDDAYEQFVSIQQIHALLPTLEHYCCMVDMLGRSKHLEEAEELVETMPFLPDYITWATLLGACRIHRDVERGSRILERVTELNPSHGASFVLLSQIAADDANEDETPSKPSLNPR